MVSVACEHLARLSIFVDAARKGEITSQHDRHRTLFQGLFQRLEADANGGLYTVMCALTTLFPPLVEYRSNVLILGRYRVAGIRNIRVPRTTSSAERHIRDFTVARTLGDIALRLAEDTRLMAKRYY